jgi:hypothetical protein
MNVVDRFIVGVFEIGKGHKQKRGAEYIIPENMNHKPGTRLNHDEHECNKAIENDNCYSKYYSTTESVIFSFSC